MAWHGSQLGATCLCIFSLTLAWCLCMPARAVQARRHACYSPRASPPTWAPSPRCAATLTQPSSRTSSTTLPLWTAAVSRSGRERRCRWPFCTLDPDLKPGLRYTLTAALILTLSQPDGRSPTLCLALINNLRASADSSIAVPMLQVYRHNDMEHLYQLLSSCPPGSVTLSRLLAAPRISSPYGPCKSCEPARRCCSHPGTD